MFGKLIDKALSLPAEVVGKTAETLVQLPALPLEIADKALEGAERGIDKVTTPKP